MELLQEYHTGLGFLLGSMIMCSNYFKDSTSWRGILPLFICVVE